MKALIAAALMGLAGVALAAEPGESTGLYQQSQAFEIRGTIYKVKGDRVAIARPNLPPAELRIGDQTQVTLEGQRVSVNVLSVGTPVRARFQLDKDEVVAVTIEAMPTHPGKPQPKGGARPTK